ncbi:MAG: dicarboxylate/amino acid:cation symporter, partial [Holosporaceae bacterium]|nr:dicarboxylate/amino acid:cation symporter [Holosporaceae bacterium]
MLTGDSASAEIFSKRNAFQQYLIAIVLGILCGCFNFALPAAEFVSDVFIRIFKCLSLPIIVVSLIVSLSRQSSDDQLKKIGRQTLVYTISATVIAAFVASVLYAIISPSNVKTAINAVREAIPAGKYSEYVARMIPSNIFSPFLENNVMGALLIGVVVGAAIRRIPNSEALAAHNFFRRVQEIFFVVIGWVVKAIPIALFGFIATAVVQLKSGANLKGLGEYLSVVVLANVVQGLVVLPIFLKANGIRPFVSMKAMAPALSIAFFSKSSVGTL